MATQFKQQAIKSFKVEFCDEAVTAWGGYVLAERVAARGGRGEPRGDRPRLDGRKRKRPGPGSMRLWRLRRTLLAVPARIATHARQASVQLLGTAPPTEAMFTRYWSAICRC